MNDRDLPIDDTLPLDEMPGDLFSDTSPIIDGDILDDEGRRVPRVVIEGVNSPGEDPQGEDYISKKRAYFTVAVLLIINLLNYMDRYTVAGVLNDIQEYYGLTKSEDGIMQTVFVILYMVFSPIFGFMGDRFTRKYIMAGGIFFWSCVTLAGSFVPKDYFWAFVMFRALVGVGEASYSTIAPTVIADLFMAEARTRMLMVFYFAIPVGSGLGYIVGSNVAKAMGAWQWALRVTPSIGIVCVILILFVVKEPRRGMAEGGADLHNTSYLQDLKALAKNKSFVLSTMGFTCVAFTTGALAFWAPLFMINSIEAQGKAAEETIVSLTFGIITVVAGFVGVAIGAESSRRLKKKNPRADPLICAFGLLACVPFLFLALLISQWYTIPTYVLILLGETVLFLNWSIVADILLYVVIPTRRSTAESIQILTSHALGDAGSPFFLGEIADSIEKHSRNPKSPSVQFMSLQYALYVTPFICVLGGGFFLATALFVEKDRNRASKITHDGYNVPCPKVTGNEISQ